MIRKIFPAVLIANFSLGLSLFSAQDQYVFVSVLEKEKKEILITLPDSFHLGYQWIAAGDIFKEFVPREENVDSWSKIITILQQSNIEASLEIIAKDMQYEFRKLYNSKELLECRIENSIENGLPVSFLIVDMPGKNTDVQPAVKIPNVNELLMTKTIKTKDKALSLQYCQRYDINLTSQESKEQIKQEMKEVLKGLKILEIKSVDEAFQIFCHKDGFKNLRFYDCNELGWIGKKSEQDNTSDQNKQFKDKKREHHLEESEMFTTSYDLMPPTQGEIKEGRYFSPNNVFSCDAFDFGEGRYLLQDCIGEKFACVAFYNSDACFKKAEILFPPRIDREDMNKIDRRDIFNRFGINILKEVDNALDVKILYEEDLEEAYFVAISIRKMSVLKSACGKYLSSTRGYLVFEDNDTVALLSNQITTLPGQKHMPKYHIEKLKREILEFRESFKFGM